MTKMKLGEALTLRARNAEKLADLIRRAERSATVQEGETAPENARDLLDDHEKLSADQAELIAKINAANVREGLIDDILLRDHLRRLIAARRKIALAASPTQRGNSWLGGEAKPWVPQIGVAVLQGQVDDLVDAANRVDARLQARNWEIEV